jgi:hypothetical protein
MVSEGRQKTFLDNVLTTRETQAKLVRKQGASHKENNQIIHLVVYGTGF